MVTAMRKHHRHHALIAAVAVCTTATAVVAATAVGAQESLRTIVLVARHNESRSKVIDTPPRGQAFGPGDMVVLEDKLRDRSGAAAGYAYGLFAMTGRRGNAQGSITFDLVGGSIEAVGIDDGNVTKLAVAGGTGKYAGTTGTVERTEDRNAQQFTIILR